MQQTLDLTDKIHCVLGDTVIYSNKQINKEFQDGSGLDTGSTQLMMGLRPKKTIAS